MPNKKIFKNKSIVCPEPISVHGLPPAVQKLNAVCPHSNLRPRMYVAIHVAADLANQPLARKRGKPITSKWIRGRPI